MQDFLAHLDSMKDLWPSTVLARSEVPKFTGGALSSGYVANCDSRGDGPEGRFRLGKQTVYPVVHFVEWLKARASNKRLPRVRGGQR
jgi:hypothetical protein